MGNNERLLIYPYNLQFSPVLRHKSLLKEYEITCLVSPNGWGLTGKDAGIADHGPDIGIIVSSDFVNSLDLCDTVMFSDSYFPFDFQKYVLSKIKLAIRAKKNIVCLIDLESEVIKELRSICNYEGVKFTYYGGTQSLTDREIIVDNERIEEVNTPVIFVIGMGERTNKFEIQLALREKIQSFGYKISQVGTRPYCEMLGFHSFPSFMYNNNFSEVHKILMFNRFIKMIEKVEEPDVIIIGIPGGIMPYNRQFTNNFGIFAYEVSQAVIPDFVIYSLLYEDYKVDAFEVLNNSLRFKLGFNADLFNIANSQFDWTQAYEEHIFSHISIDSQAVSEKIMTHYQSRETVLNVLNDGDADMMANYAIEKLCEYGNIEIV